MVLLVLRPEPQAGDMVAALAGRGVEALAEPMLTIEPCDDPVGRPNGQRPAQRTGLSSCFGALAQGRRVAIVT